MLNLLGIYMLKLFKLLVCVLVVLNFNACKCVQTKKTVEPSSEPLKKEIARELPAPYAEVIAYAEKNLPHVGTLIQKPDGYAYVKVDDRYINELFPLLHAKPGYKKPPYFRKNNLPGAHISVVYKDEHVKLKEVGQKFSFKIRDIATVNPNPKTSYIILQVDSPELENLRRSYGLGPKLHGHEFHISIAKKAK